MDDNGRIARKLETVLEKEYQALMAGEIGALEKLGAQKLAALERIAALPLKQIGGLEALRPKLLRNQLLVQSALEGMRVAISRAKETSEIAKSLKTYRSDGRPSSISTRQGSALSKRS